MKKLLVVAMAALVCLAFAGLAYADLEGSSVAHVFVDVVPNVTIAPMASSIDLGDIQTGGISTGIVFRIDANTEKVKLAAGASQLYKGDCLTCTEVAPIPISGGGILIEPEMANPVGGASPMASYIEGVVDINAGFKGQKTNFVEFESGQNNHFSQNVTIHPSWAQTDAEKPIGEYSGYVAIYAMVVPVQ